MSKGRIPQTIRFSNATFKKLEDLAINDHTSVNSIVNRIVDEHFNNKVSGVSEPAPKYTAEEFEKAETDDALRAEILSNAPDPFIRMMFAEMQKKDREKEGKT